MSKIDVLACRNVIIYFNIYFNIEAQTRVLARFHFSLKDNGFLFLGQAEMPATRSPFFTSVDIKHRVFAKVPKSSSNLRLLHK